MATAGPVARGRYGLDMNLLNEQAKMQAPLTLWQRSTANLAAKSRASGLGCALRWAGWLAGWLTNLQNAGWDSNKAEDRGGERFREKGSSTFPGRAGRGEGGEQ